MPPARFLQPPIPREARLRPAVPARIGPAEFSKLGAMVAVRCPQELDPLMRKAGHARLPEQRVRGDLATDERPAVASGALMDPSTVPWIGGAIGGGVLLMLLAWSGFHLESRRRRYVPVQEPGQIRRDNAIVIGVCLLMIMGGLLVGGGLVWWWEL
jgi:hypothetical protein